MAGEIIRLPRWLLCVFPLPLISPLRRDRRVRHWIRTLLLAVDIGGRLAVSLMIITTSWEIGIEGRDSY